MEEWIALPVVTGVKTPSEKFAGADRTYALEGLMQDNRALQAGTTHHLGQNFARAFDLRYQTETGDWEYAWNTSWGVTTRLVGALVMVHGDDNGLVLPPRLAPIQAVVVPIWKAADPRERILEAAARVFERLKARGVAVRLDDRDNVNPGFKFNEWELMGVPLRLELGPKDLDRGSIVAVKRHSREKLPVPFDDLERRVPELLEEVQAEVLDAARRRRDAATFTVDSYDEFREKLDHPGGFVLAHWGGEAETERRIKDETGATIRCIPLDGPEEPPHPCIRGGGSSTRRVYFARAY
jgi:prolyl-tRNA synthetase